MVEDETVSRRALTRLLSANGFATFPVGSAEEALRIVQEHPAPTIALVDVDLPGMSGEALIGMLGQLSPGTQAVLVTAASRDRVRELVDGGVPHLRKPLDFKDLLSILAEKGAHPINIPPNSADTA